jgi:hypothetical protein
VFALSLASLPELTRWDGESALRVTKITSANFSGGFRTFFPSSQSFVAAKVEAGGELEARLQEEYE